MTAATLTTHLQGRLKNTSLPVSHGLFPLFEAVVNSIHAIEDAGISAENGHIRVVLRREQQPALDLRAGDATANDIVGFDVIDNGIGFDGDNMASFLTLDSQHKETRGGRGIGRLLWLKAFERVLIESTYQTDAGDLRTRRFLFSATHGVRDEQDAAAAVDATKGTRVRLDGFFERYRKSSAKTASTIGRSLFEHCLWYFVRDGGAPRITLEDESDSVDLDRVYEEHMVSSAASESVELKGKHFQLTHIKLRNTISNSHGVAFCAANRLVKEEKLTGKIPGLFGRLKSEDGDFVYLCYVTSPFLDAAVRAERTSFDLAENPMPLFADVDLSFGEIRGTVIARAKHHLDDYLSENKTRARERVEKFVSSKAPRYRPILKRIPEEKLAIDPEISEKDLDLALHKQLAEVEGQLLAEGHDIMQPKLDEDPDDYRERLKSYLAIAQDIKQSDLANYVSHRRVVIDLFDRAIQRGDDGKYAREDVVHDLIMPMRKDSTELSFDSSNLWLVDERLAFHDYLASDKPISSMPITGSKERKEPDLLALNVYDNPLLVAEGQRLPLASIVVVEIKRPMRNDAAAGEDKDPVEQALGYLSRVRQGEVTTASGRPIPNSDDVPGFCYVICDVTPTVESRCKMLSLRPTHDYMGYFGFNPNFNAYIEVISFDRLVNAAKERNRAFFDKLGLPTT